MDLYKCDGSSYKVSSKQLMYQVLYIKSHYVYTTVRTNLNHLTLLLCQLQTKVTNWFYAILLGLIPCSLSLWTEIYKSIGV